MDAANEKCVPCEGGIVPLSKAETQNLLGELDGWTLITIEGIPALYKSFPFPNFKRALTFAEQVGELAEAEGHHPRIIVEWGKTSVTWWTHAIKGLHRNDFLMAAKTDRIVFAISS